jgi:tetratricopeptide (TPR) repeat protein
LEAFLLQPSPDTEEKLISEPVQSSPWDEIFSSEQASDQKVPVTPPPADELVDLLVGHLESFDWGATDNRKVAFSTIIPEHELQVEILSESNENDDHTAEPAFELEDLTNFTDALFGDELSTDTENSESEEYSLGNMLSAFKKGVDEQLDESDTETRYSLGIAYKEMGLYDEAIQEFQAAGHDPARTADCIALKGVCLKEKGDYEAAGAVFRSGLDLQTLSSEAMLNLKYELAQLLEQTENNDNALALYNEIIRVNPTYRNVQLHASRLSGEDDLDILVELNEDD